MEPHQLLASLLERAEKDLEQAQVEAARIPALQKEIDGLRLSLQRLNGSSSTPPIPPVPISTRSDWSALTRSQAILSLMKEMDRALSPAEIARELKARGRTAEDPVKISTRLDRLKKRDQVANIGRGQWVATPIPAKVPAKAENGQTIKF